MLTDVIRAGRADLYSIFRTRAHDCARALAIEDGSRKLTYAELLERVDRLAAVFLARGVAPGDRIAILSHNRSEYLEVELAAAGIGAIVACLNWRLAPDELRHCIDLVEPVLAVVEPELSEAYRAVASTRGRNGTTLSEIHGPKMAKHPSPTSSSNARSTAS